MEAGEVKINGDTASAVLSYYTSGIASPTQIDYTHHSRLPGDDYARLRKVSIVVRDEAASQEIDIGDEINVVIEYSIINEDNKLLPYPNIHVFNSAGICVFISAPSTTNVHSPSTYRAVCTIPANFLNQGAYFVGIAISSMGKGVLVHLFEQNAISFNIRDNIYNVPTRPQVDGNVAYSGEVPGTVRPLLQWKTTKIAES